MNYKEAYSYASELCSKQERCTSYIKEKLTKFETEPDVLETVIEKLKSERFLDDNRYATYFTKDKYRFEKWGRIKITYQLKLKKIPNDIIANALESIEEEQYLANLQQIIDSASRKSKETNKYKRDSKIVRMAASKGYESNLIYKLLNNPEYEQPTED